MQSLLVLSSIKITFRHINLNLLSQLLLGLLWKTIAFHIRNIFMGLVHVSILLHLGIFRLWNPRRGNAETVIGIILYSHRILSEFVWAALPHKCLIHGNLHAKFTYFSFFLNFIFWIPNISSILGGSWSSALVFTCWGELGQISLGAPSGKKGNPLLINYKNK